MKQFAWYCPEIDDIIVECRVDFLIVGFMSYEKNNRTAYVSRDFVSKYLWIPLGEL